MIRETTSIHRPKILLLSGYDAASHLYWRETLVRGLPQFDWTVLTLPARHFYWRVRSNALTFATRYRDILSGDYDLVFATSMVDISTLRGLIPSLARIPLVVYFHENQFAYPLEKPSSNIVNAQLISIMNVLCADQVLFNSEYNRHTFISGAAALLRRMPDGTESVELARCVDSASILPVPITLASTPRKPKNSPVEIIWNHRWEYDKQPEVFFAALRQLKLAQVEFVVHVVGQSFRQVPECFAQARENFAKHIGAWGYQSRETYETLLLRSDIAVSTALHDFQGLSLLEAMTAGCLAIAPDRVAYPEYVPDSWRYHVATDAHDGGNCRGPDVIERETASLRDLLLQALQLPESISDLPNISRYSWRTLQGEYVKVIEETMQ